MQSNTLKFAYDNTVKILFATLNTFYFFVAENF